VALLAEGHQHLALGALRDNADQLELGVAVARRHQLILARALLAEDAGGRLARDDRDQQRFKRIAVVLGVEVALAERVADAVALGAGLAVAALVQLQAVEVLAAARRLRVALAVLG